MEGDAIDKHLRSLTIAEYGAIHTQLLLESVSWRLVRASRRQKPEAIHDLRVAIRRLLNGLEAFKPLLPKAGRRRVRKRLRSINKLAGKVRDIDIAIDVMFSSLKVQDRPIHGRLRGKRKEAKSELKDELRRWIGRGELEEWHGELGFSSVDWKQWTQSKVRQTAKKHVYEILPPVAAEFFERGRALSTTSAHESLHKFRLHGKRLRDLLELFEPLYGARMESILSVIRETHHLLGDFNDLVTTREMLADRGFSDSRPRLFGAINARIDEKTGQFLAVWTRSLAAPETEDRWRKYLGTGEWLP